MEAAGTSKISVPTYKRTVYHSLGDNNPNFPHCKILRSHVMPLLIANQNVQKSAENCRKILFTVVIYKIIGSKKIKFPNFI
jgi:hypothetical protein